MPNGSASVLILGDKILANRYFRYARQRWLDTKRRFPGRSLVLSWRPHPDVLVRVQTNPDKILIKAGSVEPSIYYLHHEGERVTAGTSFGWPLDENHEWRSHRSVISPRKAKHTVPLPEDDYFEPPTNNRRYRPWGSGSWFPGQLMFSVLGCDVSSGEASRLNIAHQFLGWPTTLYQGGWTENYGSTWLTYVSANGNPIALQYMGLDTDLLGNPIGRYAVYGLLDTQFLLSTDDPDTFLVVDVSGLRNGWGLHYIGGTTTQLMDNIEYGMMRTGDGVYDAVGDRAWRYVTHNYGRNWTSEIGWPSSYNATRFAIFSFCKLSTGNYLAIYPDAGGDMHCWLSGSGESTWVKRAKLTGLIAQPGTNPAVPDFVNSSSLSPCDNGDALFFVQSESLGTQLWAIYDEGSIVARRPDPWSTSAGAIDSDRWSIDLHLNVFGDDSGTTTIDNARLVFIGTDDNTFDAGATNVTGSQLEINSFNNSEDQYLLYCDNGGSVSDWKIGAKIAIEGEEVDNVVTKHYTKNGRPLNHLINTYNWLVTI